jgi:hypothetical protein
MTSPAWSRYGSRLRRICARAGCNAPAVATLRFEPTERLAWLAELDEAAARTQGDLCQRHAAALVLPRGWELHDERVVLVGAATDVGEQRPERVAGEAAEPIEQEDEPAAPEDEAPAEVEPEPPVAANGNATRTVPAQFGATDDDAVDEAVTEELDTILDARTPLLRRAFRNARPESSN